MNESATLHNELSTCLSSRVLLSPEILENILFHMRDNVAAVQRVCSTWHKIIQSSLRIGLYKGHQPSAQYLPSGRGDWDPDLELPKLYFNIQDHVFPEDIWYLSPKMRVKPMPGKSLDFIFDFRGQYIRDERHPVRGCESGVFPPARQFFFNFSESTPFTFSLCPHITSTSASKQGMSKFRPSWHNIQLSYPAITTLRFRMADVLYRPADHARARTPEWPEVYNKISIKNALQFQLSCESGITYGHLIDAFSRNYERKGILLLNNQTIAWFLRLPIESEDCTKFVYDAVLPSSVDPGLDSTAVQEPTIHESELVGRVVKKHRSIGWFLWTVNMVLEGGESAFHIMSGSQSVGWLAQDHPEIIET